MIGLLDLPRLKSIAMASLAIFTALLVTGLIWSAAIAKVRLEKAQARVAELEISLAETQARAAASETALEALALTTARRGAIQAQASQDIEAVQSTPEAIADVETASPAIGSALNLLRERSDNGR